MELLTNMTGAMDLKIFSTLHRSGRNGCSDKPCSHLCVSMPGEGTPFKCLCPDGKITKAVFSYHCRVSLTCFLPLLGMKAEIDASSGRNVCRCPDGSVPTRDGLCPQSNGSCNSSQFTCLTNQLCIPEAWKCECGNDSMYRLQTVHT